jgi:hypothetical protein
VPIGGWEHCQQGDRDPATTAWGAIDNGGFPLGGGVGAAAIGVLGAGAVTGTAACLFAIAAFLALRLPWVTATETDEPEAETAGLSEALAGMRTLRDTPRRLCALRSPCWQGS